MDFVIDIKGHCLEYYEDEHLYLVDGKITPSITQLLKYKYNSKYENINAKTLRNASEKGTAVHEAIEQYCKTGEVSELPEVRNFRFLQKQYKFEVLKNEVPVILFKNDEPISAGRLDLVLKDENGNVGLADIKRTSTLDKDYLAYQLNMYRLAYEQCYDEPITFLKGIHLREDVRKYVNIPINEEVTWLMVDEFLGKTNNEELQ